MFKLGKIRIRLNKQEACSKHVQVSGKHYYVDWQSSDCIELVRAENPEYCVKAEILNNEGNVISVGFAQRCALDRFSYPFGRKVAIERAINNLAKRYKVNERFHITCNDKGNWDVVLSGLSKYTDVRKTHTVEALVRDWDEEALKPPIDSFRRFTSLSPQLEQHPPRLRPWLVDD